jgi:epoxyqueuosine reductase QueG
MYRINLNNYKEKFLIDSSDSFFKNQGKIHFDKNYSDDKKVDLAKSIIAQIPNSFFKAMNKNTFGCPDCSDGCGVYFEFRNKGEIKKFYIDTDTTKLTEPVKSFEINIRKVISKLGNATD